MSWKLYDYVDGNGRNKFKEWSEDLDQKQLAKLNSKLDDLAQHGTFLSKYLLSETGVPHIQKLRFKGNVAMRPLLCKGPTRDDHMKYNKEFTLLCGAIEKDRKLIPADAFNQAKERREEVIKKPYLRRREHEPVRSKTKK